MESAGELCGEVLASCYQEIIAPQIFTFRISSPIGLRVRALSAATA
jgi:hypothetical protein